MKRLKGASNTRKELSSFYESSSRVFHRRRDDYLPENSSSNPFVRSYNRSRIPRLRWTNELHQCFVNAVQELGGEEKATPKMILPMMKGLTLSHIKSHLQMFRSMKNDVILQEAQEGKQAENCNDNHLWKKVDKETSRSAILRKNKLKLAGFTSNANDDTEIAREPFVASLSSSSVVDIELTLGGPYASLRSCESDKNVYV